jgi:alkylation response protein AidB-like acyl-CoA dehydrogenase
MYKLIFKNIKRIVPKVSETELIALRSGTTSIDRDIFKGKVNTNFNFVKKENKFDNSKIDDLFLKYKNNFVYPNRNKNQIINYLGKNKFFSFIIDEKYEGTNLSVREMSSILTKITSFNPSIGITTMVPNSLGPGELLQHYGTEDQKNKYLPGLVNGSFIPCFGLTGPYNGSDATGSIDTGEVILNCNGKKVIKIQLNKRYITLAPVSNLIGLAFRLDDPQGLLSDGKEGITVALVENNINGLIQESHHNPLNTGFPNGTLKGNIEIPVEDIIGGEKKAGHGWKMLMECLAAGRGISLPATANASSKSACYGIINYAKHRKQFKLPLIEMEGVQEKIINMVFHTWIIQSSIALTNEILDSGEKPSVISAIMKQQSTDRGRLVLNDAMDIHAGSSICIGENNFLEKFYRCAPIGITVEGSNTLTRNLIIFGQGLNKSHPHIYSVLDSILIDDIDKFKTNFNLMVKHVLSLYCKSWIPNLSNNSIDKLKQQTIHFAHLSNIVALKGGAIKREQFLSADMADIFSNLYLAYSIKWFEDTNKISTILTEYCINRLVNENQMKINKIITNSPIYSKILTFQLISKQKVESYNNNTNFINEIKNNNKIMDEFKKDIYIKNTILEDLDKLNDLKSDSKEYEKLYNKIIQVGEYKNVSNI